MKKEQAMIEQAFNKLKKQILKPTTVENEWNEYPSEPRIQSTVDEGKGLNFNDKAQAIWNSIKELNK